MSSLNLTDPDSICPKSLAPVVNLKPLKPIPDSKVFPRTYPLPPQTTWANPRSQKPLNPFASPPIITKVHSILTTRTHRPGRSTCASTTWIAYARQLRDARLRNANLGQNTSWCTIAAWREEYNPFPTIHLRDGWNLARCQGILWHGDHTIYDGDGVLGSMEHEVSARQSLARFSFWAQREPMQFDDDDEDRGGEGKDGWVKVFAMVFKGEKGLGMCWAREPGSWRAARAGLLTCCRGVDFLADVEQWGASVQGRVQAWKESNEGWWDRQKARKKTKRKSELELESRNQPSDWKKGGARPDDEEERRKRLRREGPAPVKVWSEGWRRRRREQEKKAWGWLDGTARQDRMWAEFYWVLNCEDPRAIHCMTWPSEYQLGNGDIAHSWGE